MLEGLLNWLVGLLWSKPADWTIRTDDRQVRYLARLGQMQQVFSYRLRKGDLAQPYQPVRPAWAGTRAEDSWSTCQRDVRPAPMLEGRKLFTVAEDFRKAQVAERARTQLAEMADRIEATADRWFRELCADTGFAA